MFRCVPGVGMYFGSMHWLRSNFGSQDPHPLESLAIGALARSFSASVLIPVTVVKTRFESRQYQYGGVGIAFKQIYTDEGFRGLTRGLSATLLRDAPFSGCYLMFYTTVKKNMPAYLVESQAQPLVHFSCGIVSGIMASLVTQPADVVKTKMQVLPAQCPEVRSAILYIYKTYGWKGFLKGVVPRSLRRTLMAAMAWTLYEQLTRQVGLK